MMDDKAASIGGLFHLECLVAYWHETDLLQRPLHVRS
jgi:hypothetical protein